MTDHESKPKRRIGIFGWGVVAPRSPDVDSFRDNLSAAEEWLEPFEDFGPNNFLVGKPDFEFEKYHQWIDDRFPPSRFSQLQSKMGGPTLFAVGSYIQALGQNPGIEQALQEMGSKAHVYVGTGLGDLPTIAAISLQADRAQREWDAFWASSEFCPARAAFEAGDAPPETIEDIPPHPDEAPPGEQEDARRHWNSFWASRSSRLREYLDQLKEIETLSVEGEVESGKASIIREKMKRATQLRKDWNAPPEPWAAISANVLWNIHSAPATQISMMGKITGPSFAPVAACSTFGVSLKFGIDAIEKGEAEAVVIGATDPDPHPLTVGAFSAARVLASDGNVSKPLTGLRGTHVSGGACVWIIGDLEKMTARGFQPIGMEPLAVGVTSDADHIITPSEVGPMNCIREALEKSGAQPDEIATWDLHCTATPGDYLEVENARRLLPDTVVMTARKGTFGHGMGTCGGWELTAQMLAAEQMSIPPTPLTEAELNPEISRVHNNFVFDNPVPLEKGYAGKLSMGVGGINSCIICRPWSC
ncbi:MAG: beta-ketoacyl synthase N-terminal-like domain-containing protein [Planctomycetota bacterium]|nr:beta-ketoacyl synthase N-terminal-like domain-containing protein [Planctomycetota bacterium]